MSEEEEHTDPQDDVIDSRSKSSKPTGEDEPTTGAGDERPESPSGEGAKLPEESEPVERRYRPAQPEQDANTPTAFR